jgi:hypothetical protein
VNAMRVFGSWLERGRTRAAGHIGAVGVVVIAGVVVHAGVLHHIAGTSGSIWS